MPHFNEAQLEASIMKLFLLEGYEYCPGETITDRLPDEVLIREDLRRYLHDRYAQEGITDMEVENAIRYIEQKTGGTLYEENCRVMSLVMNGFSLKREDAQKANLYIYPVSFDQHADKNIYKIVNQLEIQGLEQKRIPDGLVYVNGLPLVVMEFKSAIKENTTILDAWKQVTVRYVRDIPQLLRWNALVVISDGVNNRFGSVFADYEYFTAWRKIEPQEKPIDGIPSLQTMVKGLFKPERFLDVLHNFIYVPDSSKRQLKVVCRYPQYYGARALYKNILVHSKLNAGGDGKGGTYFGATGCGKSFTMLFLTRLLMKSKELCSPTILLITDRTDLDDQLSRQVLEAKQFIGDEMVMQVESREHLKELLQGRSSGGVFLTTIQKFSKDIDLLSKRQNIICISDEAHRSQTCLEENIRVTDRGVQRSYGFAKYLHDSLPNATYVGFTGTPIDATLDVFGPVVDEYTMIDAVNDDVTKRIVYEGRASKVIIDSKKVREIEDYYNHCAEEGASEYQIEESKKAMTQMSVILGDPELIHRLSLDFIQHYERRLAEGSSVEGKAMIVCPTREIGYAIYKEIIKARPEWAEKRVCAEGAQLTKAEQEKIKPLERVKMVFIRDKDDEAELWNLLGSDEERKKLDLQFKEPKSNFKIAIVVDMWITGFDVPCLDTLYCYKPLQMHTLIQTVSRVNRPYPRKDKGLIVDYLGIKKNMNAAMQKYARGGMEETPIEVVDEAVKMFKDELSVLRGYFHLYDYSKFFSGTGLEQLECLQQGAELMQVTKEQEKNFMKHTRLMKQAFNICSNDDRVTEHETDEMHYFTGVRAVIYKMVKGDAPDATTMNHHVLKMVEEALSSEEVEVLNNMGMENARQVDLLAHQYMDKIVQLPYKNTKVKLMERLLKQVIGSMKLINRLRAIDFSSRLDKIVERYNDRTDDLIFAEEVIKEVTQQLVNLLDDIVKDNELPEGVPDIEVKAFYDILITVAKQYDFDEQYTEEQYAEMANAVKRIVDDKSQYVDCFRRDDIKAAMQVDIIVELSKHGFPPVSYNDVYKAIMEQAENFKRNKLAHEVKLVPNQDGLAQAAEPNVHLHVHGDLNVNGDANIGNYFEETKQ